jgi:hypothetical protein
MRPTREPLLRSFVMELRDLERSLIRRRRQCLLQLFEQALVRGVVAEPLLATADQRLVLGHARVIDVVLPT